MKTVIIDVYKRQEYGRHEPFLHKVSTPENRKKIEDFQLEALKRKATLLPRFEKYCTEKSYSFRHQTINTHNTIDTKDHSWS